MIESEAVADSDGDSDWVDVVEGDAPKDKEEVGELESEGMGDEEG